MGEKRCYALLCSYDGGAFSGFQRQPPLTTIQGAFEEAIRGLGISGTIEGSGRTDAGVHARRQIVAIRTRDSIDSSTLPLRLARRLPRALVVLDAREVDPSFHPRHSAVAKIYRYRITTSPNPTPWEKRFTWVLPDIRGFPDLDPTQVPIRLDEEATATTLTAVTGRHDFSAMVHPNASGKRVRLLTRAELRTIETRWEGKLYEMTLAAPGFLRHQIRNIVGISVTAGLGRLASDELQRLLQADGDRWRGARAPGRGLTLWDIQYRHGEDPFRNLPRT